MAVGSLMRSHNTNTPFQNPGRLPSARYGIVARVSHTHRSIRGSRSRATNTFTRSAALPAVVSVRVLSSEGSVLGSLRWRRQASALGSGPIAHGAHQQNRWSTPRSLQQYAGRGQHATPRAVTTALAVPHLGLGLPEHVCSEQCARNPHIHATLHAGRMGQRK